MDNIASYLEIIPQNEFGGALFAQALKSYQPFCDINVDLNNLDQIYQAAQKYSQLTPDRVKRDG